MGEQSDILVKMNAGFPSALRGRGVHSENTPWIKVQGACCDIKRFDKEGVSVHCSLAVRLRRW